MDEHYIDRLGEVRLFQGSGCSNFGNFAFVPTLRDNKFELQTVEIFETFNYVQLANVWQAA